VLDDAAETLLLADHDPHAVLTELANRDVVSVLLEGGPGLAASFVAAGLVDKVVGYVAPALLGAGRSVLAPMGIETIADTLRLQVDDVRLIGGDVRVVAYPLKAVSTEGRE
jgi:diaminohydroxyphosphoribosylaminopyrimidine deaminase/5-amino-6-(5-phosphoribosylamino)uracil reductase